MKAASHKIRNLKWRVGNREDMLAQSCKHGTHLPTFVEQTALPTQHNMTGD
jgi:hypothetical protein